LAQRVVPLLGSPHLIEALEAAPTARASGLSFRMPIQRVSRPGESFRGYQGTVAAGSIAIGDRVVVAPSGQSVTVLRIVTFDRDVKRADAGAAVTLVFDRKVDAARGDVLTATDATPLTGRDFTATVVTLQADGLKDGARLWLKAAGRMKRVRVSIDEAYDLGAGRWTKSTALPVNAIGRVRLRFEEEAIFDRFADCRDTGAFILISPQTNNTVAGGMVSDLAEADSDGDERVTLSVPQDLAEFILCLPAVKARRSEIEILPER